MLKKIELLFGSLAVLLLVTGVFVQNAAACSTCAAHTGKEVSAAPAKGACPTCKAGEPCAACAVSKAAAKITKASAGVKKACPTCKAGEPCVACAAKKLSAASDKKACPACKAAGEPCAACAASMAADGKKKPEVVRWLTDFAKAQVSALKKKRNILVNFSGSDWCHWCIKLDEEVLSKKAFKDYTRGRLVLVNADFPRKTELAAKIKAQNEKLAAKYGIKGFPTVLLLNPEGKVLAQTGYQKGGPEAYIKHLDKILADAKKKEEAAKKAGAKKSDSDSHAGHSHEGHAH